MKSQSIQRTYIAVYLLMAFLVSYSAAASDDLASVLERKWEITDADSYLTIHGVTSGSNLSFSKRPDGSWSVTLSFGENARKLCEMGRIKERSSDGFQQDTFVCTTTYDDGARWLRVEVSGDQSCGRDKCINVQLAPVVTSAVGDPGNGNGKGGN